MKKLIVFLTVFLIFFSTVPVYAEEQSTPEEPVVQEAVFDLNAAYQERTIIDSKGLETTIRVTSSLDGTHLIESTNAELSMSFKIKVSNNRITQAYDASYSSSTWTITSSSLVINSTTRATLTLQCRKLLIINASKYLQADISSGSLVVTAG